MLSRSRASKPELPGPYLFVPTRAPGLCFLRRSIVVGVTGLKLTIVDSEVQFNPLKL